MTEGSREVWFGKTWSKLSYRENEKSIMSEDSVLIISIMIIIHTIFYFIFKCPAHTACSKRKKIVSGNKASKRVYFEIIVRIIALIFYSTLSK